MSSRKPDFSFTIPSIHDDTNLKCRLYQTGAAVDPDNLLSGHKAAIVAHPYASLGGSYDDPVVLDLVSTLLRKDFIVGTFNFRGTAGSGSRTSWSAKPELSDYVSFYGFMLCYVSGLRNELLTLKDGQEARHLSRIRSIPQTVDGLDDAYSAWTLLLAGYSYGSLIASHLPALEVVVDLFSSPSLDSAESEIRLRAAHISKECITESRAKQQRTLQRLSRGRTSLRFEDALPGSPVAVGGFESEAASRRISRESARRSIDGQGIRRSVERVRHKLGQRHHNDGEVVKQIEKESMMVKVVIPKICYLLVSPLLPPVSTYVTMFSNLSFNSRLKAFSAHGRDIAIGTTEEPLVQNLSLAVYGDKDVFTSQRKLRKWAERLKRKPGSKFEFREITGAGHFWHEVGVEEGMKDAIGIWLAAVSTTIVDSTVAAAAPLNRIETGE